LVIVSDIQRFCLHDGPGIRTTLFLKGCSLRCPWCANPETIIPEIQTVTDKQGNHHTFGKSLSLSQIKEELLRDHSYYENGGGVTYSGGEPLLQFTKIEQLLNDLCILEVNQWIETSLFASIEGLKTGIKYIDGWYVDCKILYDNNICRTVTGGDLELFMRNLDHLFSNVPKNKIIFRFPFVPNMTDSEQNQTALVRLVNNYTPAGVEVIKAHNLGKSKYEKMGLQAPQIGEIDSEKLQTLVGILKNCKVPVSVLDI
jgi:pyruvate formate lyase activating enzyme